MVAIGGSRTDGDAVRRRILQHVEALPVLPTVIARLLALDPRDDHHFEQVLTLLESDPSSSVRIIAAANSAASAPPSPITTLRAAMMRLGSQHVSNLVTTGSITRVFVPHTDQERGLWRHALHVALTARALATHAPAGRVDPDEAYLCGLLHDIGHFVLFQQAPEHLHRLGEQAWADVDALTHAERQLCGATHAELGAAACKHWRLPEIVVHVVREHHAARPITSGRVAALLAVIQLADAATYPLAHGDAALEPEATRWHRVHARVVATGATLDAARLHAIVEHARHDAEVTGQLLGVG